jgi:hypothetical protein
MTDETVHPSDAEEARLLAEAIVETIRQPLLILLSEDLTVRSANRAFYETFQVQRAQTETCLLYDVGLSSGAFLACTSCCRRRCRSARPSRHSRSSTFSRGSAKRSCCSMPARCRGLAIAHP